MPQRTPKQLIELYWTEVWNNRRTELMAELCADPIIRHDPGSVTPLSLADQMARVAQQSEQAEPFFEHEILHADDRFVTSVWNMHTRKGPRIDLCGIEVFEARDGKFIRCWNSSYVAGRWGRDGDSSVPADLPPPALISGVDGVTPAWLQSVFQHGGIDSPRISLVASEPIGAGNLSATSRTRITYNANAADAVGSVVCKLTSGVGAALDIAQTYGVYAREVAVYRFFGKTAPLNIPACYLAQASDDGRAINLVLEDLSGRTRAGHQVAGCSIADAHAVVTEFAKLHTACWHDPRLDSADWLYGRAGKADQLDASYPLASAEWRKRFSGQIDERYFAAIDHYADKAGDLLRRHADGGPTLIHGEPRVDNVLFEDGDDGTTAWLIDWQFADRGSPMFDTAYFLAGSLKPADRKACERDLIAGHQAAIAAVDPTYTLERAQADYANALPLTLFTTVGSILAVPSTPATDQLLKTLLTRNVDALADWGMVG